jgi:hypothetical protein
MRYAGILAFAAVTLTSINALAADFTVTVGRDASNNFVWVVNGQNNPTLTLNRGQTYTFSVTSPGHPFDIKTAAVTGTGSQFTTGVTGQEVQSGTLTFAVPTDPTVPPLFYQCEVHGTMSGLINLATVNAPASNNWGLALLALSLVAGGFVALRMRRQATA